MSAPPEHGGWQLGFGVERLGAEGGGRVGKGGRPPPSHARIKKDQWAGWVADTWGRGGYRADARRVCHLSMWTQIRRTENGFASAHWANISAHTDSKRTKSVRWSCPKPSIVSVKKRSASCFLLFMSTVQLRFFYVTSQLVCFIYVLNSFSQTGL